ncbi:MAG: S41 family peptidase [Candidatus Paceibacterota bacterium]|jgi:carboxyl-terminal processing protease
MKIITKNTICTVLIGAAFLGGFYFNNYINEKESLTLQAVFSGMDLGLMKDVLDVTTNNYVDPSKIDKQKLTYGAISGMVNAIGDPYTVFFNPQETKDFKESISGKFSGIGIQVGVKDGKIKVIAPIKGTPAYRAGILAKDTIIEVDKKSISNLSIDEVISMIKGPKGTKVSIGILRDSGEVKTFEIIRDEIVMPSVDLKIEQSTSNKKIAILTIYQFSDTVFQDFKTAANEILNQNVDGIVLDLRNNPGGLLDQTIDIASWFLNKGDLVLTEQDRNLNKITHLSEGPSALLKFPTVVLVNEGTASAAEILSGALRDNRHLDIIGEKTFGKGVVQRVIDLRDSSSLKVTVTKWFTPSGELIQDTGILPTIEVELTEDDLEKNNDTQMNKGLEQLNKIIK